MLKSRKILKMKKSNNEQFQSNNLKLNQVFWAIQTLQRWRDDGMKVNSIFHGAIFTEMTLAKIFNRLRSPHLSQWTEVCSKFAKKKIYEAK